jgi:hypothetical protein
MSDLDLRHARHIPRFLAPRANTLIAGALVLICVAMNVAYVAGARDCMAGTDSPLCSFAQIFAR